MPVYAAQLSAGLLWLAAAALTAPDPASSPVADAPPVDPQRAFERRNLAPVVAWLESLSAETRDSAAGLRAQAWLARRRGDDERAVELIGRAIESAPDRADLRVDRAAFRKAALDDAGAFKSLRIGREVRRDLEAAVAAEPGNPDALSALISFHRQAPGIVGGSDDRARALTERLRELSEAHYRELSARRSAEAGDRDAAIEQMRLAVSGDVDVPLEWRHRLAHWLAAERRTRPAFEAWMEVLARTPNHGPSLFGVGRLAAQTGTHTGVGIDALRRLLASPAWPGDPDPALAWHRLGELHRRVGRPDLARRAFEQALDLDPDLDAARAGLESLD